uniref:Uncharacterized protein n=1 Tax=Arundo donax TaxID=35708 RepID=A0A0A9A8P1_ARUDO
MFDKFSDEKVELLREIGFGCLMNLNKQDRFNRQLAFWLLLMMDQGNGSLILSNKLQVVSESFRRSPCSFF